MENTNEKTSGGNLKKIGIICAVLLVLAIIAVNLFGTGSGVEGDVINAFKTAFQEEREVTASLYEDFPMEKKLRDLNAGNTSFAYRADITGVGKTNDDILDSVLSRASIEGVTNKDAANALTETKVALKFNDKNLMYMEGYTNGDGLTVSFPEALEKSYIIAGEEGSIADIIGSTPTEVYTMDKGYLSSMGDKAADYFLTLLKFGTYEEKEDGSIYFTVDEGKMDQALSFVKSLLGERLAAKEDFPIDANSIRVNSLNAGIILSEDKKLEDSLLKCSVGYALKSDPETMKSADFTASFSKRGGFVLVAAVSFENGDSLGVNVNRTYTDGIYNIESTLFITYPENSTACTLNNIYYKDAEDKDRTTSLKVLTANASQGFEVRSDYKVSEEEGRIIMQAEDAEIRRLSDENGVASVAKLNVRAEGTAFDGEIVVPEAVDMETLTREENAKLTAKLAGNFASNVFASIFG